MNGLRKRLTANASRDDGMTLVEVMVAMLIFAIVSMGVIYTMLSVMTIGRDSRARQVAANLAAEAIDRAREEDDIFQLLDGTYTRELNGDRFTVTRTTAWVSDPDSDITCGGGGEALRYKRVNVEVSWDNMRAGSTPARSDTIIDPKNRINDPTKGTILVSVVKGDGLGNAGVTVTARPTDAAGNPTGAALPPAQTDAQGCAYLLRVDPGDYQVSISKPGHQDIHHVATPTDTTSVAASATASVAFTYDELSRLRLTYAPGADPGTRVASTTPTTLISTYGITTPSGSGGNPRTFDVFPFASGYDVLAGRYAPYREVDDGAGGTTVLGCLSPDPAEWPGGERAAATPAPPGETSNGHVHMGLVELAVGGIPSSGQRYVLARAVATPPAETGDPGCVETYEFRFDSGTLSSSGTAVIALPYGTWELYRGGSSPTTRITGEQMTPLTNGRVNGSGTSATVTMDPRP